MNSGAAAAAFERDFARKAKAGRPPDALRRYCADEAERFWAWTVPGPDGHVFWTGAESFTRNDKRSRRPRRWVWESLNGPTPVTTDVWTTCGEANCVSPDHLAAGRTAARERFTEAQVIGTLQVAALRLGHPPNRTEWDADRYRPSTTVVTQKFGSWSRALERAGLDPAAMVRLPSVTDYTYDPATIRDLIVRGIRELTAILGHPPSLPDWSTRHRAWRLANGYPSDKTIRRAFGSWARARKAAQDDD